MGGLDFSVTPVVLQALVVGAALPFYLSVIARLPPFFGRNALQFVLAAVVMIVLWIGLVVFGAGRVPTDPTEICTGALILGAGSLFYLEIWALLSRGYTLGLLLTLFRAEGPLNEEELARFYRGGEGLRWIMRHRLSGLAGARLIREEAGLVTLTPFGVLVGRLYKLSITGLGLRRTG